MKAMTQLFLDRTFFAKSATFLLLKALAMNDFLISAEGEQKKENKKAQYCFYYD